jgi:glucose/arabinose dehydrogenase
MRIVHVLGVFCLFYFFQVYAADSVSPAIPPSWAQGRPPELANSTLAPNPPGLIALPLDEIPLKSLKVPQGFEITIWASGMANPRSMAVSTSGTVFVGTRFTGNVYAVLDHGDHREVKLIAKGLHRPNGLAFKDGSLYVAELSRILRFDQIETNLDHPPAPVVVYDQLPKDEAHGWKYMRLSPDGKSLYFQIGAPGNIVMPPETHARIVKLNLDTNQLETVAKGVRNSVGMDFDPQSGDLWFTNNGRDWVNDDLPNDTLNHITHKGMNFGYPYCHQGDLADPDFGSQHSCKEFDAPAMKIAPHVAALGMRFYTGKQFPTEYQHNIFIAEHGSWNRTQKVGYQVIRVVLDQNGKTLRQESFVTGWLKGDLFWGRPTDVLELKDGSLLISDDYSGAIFKVSYIQK